MSTVANKNRLAAVRRRHLRWIALGCGIGLAFSLNSSGAVFSPRIVPERQADTYSLKTFGESPLWKDLPCDAKIARIFEYLIDPHTGLYPMGVPAWEGAEELSEFGAVTDPVKMLNVYPIGHCGTLGPTAAAIFEGIGFPAARALILPGWNHVAAEVQCDNKWRYVDLDVRAIFKRPDGSLASFAEAQREAALWERPNAPGFFPLDNLADVRRAYARTEAQPRYHWAPGGHTMDFILRKGESFTRWWKPQGGRWNHHPSYAAAPFPRDLLERSPRGPKCKHPSFTEHSHANGRFLYKPDLRGPLSDLSLHSSQNIQTGQGGLSLREPGKGFLVLEIRSPWVIVPLVGNLETTVDDRQASVLRLDGQGWRTSISTDNGLTWQSAGQPPAGGSGKIDLTAWASGRYGYLLKIELEGPPATTQLRNLEVETWVQIHPASLPALRKGQNRLRLITGDHYGLNTKAVSFTPSTAIRGDFLNYMHQPPQDYDPNRKTSRVRGEFVVRLSAPPGARVAWFSAGASFVTHQRKEASKTRNAIAYALENPSNTYREIYRANVPEDQSHWHYNVDREVRLETPAREVYIKYTADPGLNNFRIYGHLLEEQPSAETLPLRVRHEWTENGQKKTKELMLSSGAEYEVIAEQEPTNELVELSLP